MCDDPSCAACATPAPVSVSPGSPVPAPVTMHDNSTGTEYNIADGIEPLPLTGYHAPADLQHTFFTGAIEYSANGDGTCKTGTTNSATNAESPSCMRKGTGSVDECKADCDNDSDCFGFNVVYNTWNEATTSTWNPTSGNPGGVCIFMRSSPESLGKQTCANWQGETECVQPGADKNWYCCRRGWYYEKDPAAAPPTVDTSPNGTIVETHHNGTTVVTTPPPAPTACTVIEGGTSTAGTHCQFPFTFQGVSYSYCPSVESTVPWCTTGDAGAWGVCDTNSCSTSAPAATAGEDTAATAAAGCTGCCAIADNEPPTNCVFPTLFGRDENNDDIDHGNNCISDGHEQPWCFIASRVTDAAGVTTQAWGNCQSGCSADQVIPSPPPSPTSVSAFPTSGTASGSAATGGDR